MWKLIKNKSTGEENKKSSNLVRLQLQAEGRGAVLEDKDVWPSEKAGGIADLLQDNDHHAAEAWDPDGGLAHGLSWVRGLGPWTSWHLRKHPPLLPHLSIAEEGRQEIVLVREYQ